MRKKTIHEPFTSEWLAERIIVNPNNGCWEWLFSVNDCGYAALTIRSLGKGHKAYRYFYRHYNGEIPKGVGIRHTCHNRLCVCPNHLIKGTQQENMQDMILAGRQNKGETNGQHKLKEYQVLQIREKYAAGGITYKMLAEEYGVHIGTIVPIVKRKTWKHL
jgi:hypothetical protein